MGSFPFRVSEHNDGLVVVLESFVVDVDDIKSVFSQKGTHLDGGTLHTATVQHFDFALDAANFAFSDGGLLFFFTARQKKKRQSG